MPQIEPQDKTLAALKGLHLWHAPLSSCSQRVRLVLAELERDFESHLINLEAGEHATASYQAIHPKGIVPALVDDGKLFIESIDIIRHLAGTDTALTSGPNDLLALADGAQLDLKLLTFEFLFKGAPPAPEEKAKAFQENHKNAWLKQFYKDFANGFDRDRIDHAVRRAAACFGVLEARLVDGRPYLSGDAISLADIAWLPNTHRFSLMDWPWERYPYVSAWFERLQQRPSYHKALLGWQPDEVTTAFSAYTDLRYKEGTNVRAFGDICSSVGG